MLPPASTGLDPTAREPSPPRHPPLRVQAASFAVALRPAGPSRGARSDGQSYKHPNVRSDVVIGGRPGDFLSDGLLVRNHVDAAARDEIERRLALAQLAHCGGIA